MDPSVALILVTLSFISGAILGAIYGLRTGDRIIKMHQETVATFIAMLLANGWQHDDDDEDDPTDEEAPPRPNVLPFRNGPVSEEPDDKDAS